MQVNMDTSLHGALVPRNWPDTTAGEPTPTVIVFEGEQPLAAVNRFVEHHDLTSKHAQLILDSLCQALACEANATRVLSVSDFLLSLDDDAAVRRQSYDKNAGRRSAMPLTPLLVPPARSVPEGMRLTRSHVLDGGEIFVVDDVVSPAVQRRWSAELERAPMVRSTGAGFENYARYYATPAALEMAHKAYSVDFDVAKIIARRHPVYVRVAELLGHLFPGEDLDLIRVDGHSTEYGSIHFPHQDYEQGRRHLTVLYYANAAWPPHFGGETLFLTPDHDPVHAVAPRPGRVVAFRGYIHHQVGIPSRHCEIARLTTVFRLLSVATGTGNT